MIRAATTFYGKTCTTATHILFAQRSCVQNFGEHFLVWVQQEKLMVNFLKGVIVAARAPGEVQQRAVLAVAACN